jgi:hypothetical protein
MRVRAIGTLIVNYDQISPGGPAHIEFEPIGTFVESFAKRRNRVFAMPRKPRGAAVTENFQPRPPSGYFLLPGLCTGP